MNALTLLGIRADEHAHRRAVAERHDGRDALALHGLQQGVADLVGVYVELRQQERTFALVGHLLQDRTQCPARAAPGGPEVDDHRTGLRALDDELLEVRIRDLDDVRGSDAHTPSSVREDRRNRQAAAHSRRRSRSTPPWRRRPTWA